MSNSLVGGVTVLTVTALLFAAFASRSAQRTTPMTIHGVVAGTWFTPPAGSGPSETVASHYSSARVCADTNNNLICDAGEASTTTDASGAFHLHSQSTGPVIVEVSTAS